MSNEEIKARAEVEQVESLTAERDAAIKRIERILDEWRKTGRAVISEMNRADKAEAERDALAARVAQVEALADHWAKRAASDYEAGGTLTWGAADVHFSAVLREALVEPIGQEVDLPLHRTEAGSALDTMGADQ